MPSARAPCETTRDFHHFPSRYHDFETTFSKPYCDSASAMLVALQERTCCTRWKTQPQSGQTVSPVCSFSSFGVEMTTATGTCQSCGASGEVARLVVYVRAPGVVARCPACASVLMVLVTIRERTCVDLRGLATLEPGSVGGAPR